MVDNLLFDLLKYIDFYFLNLYICKWFLLLVIFLISWILLFEYIVINKMYFKIVVKFYLVSVFRMKLRVGNYKVFIIWIIFSV